MLRLKFFALASLLVAGLIPLSGCGGVECGPGTTEDDGECVAKATGCGEGTRLENGECLEVTSGCGSATVLGDDGTCVPTEEVCQDGTIFDSGTGTCVSGSDITCGPNTQADAEGKCIPSGEVCADKTVLNNDGRCVVDTSACASGTVLDPTSGDCVVGAGACGAGLALDVDTGTCAPTDEVCASGTVFDTDTGLCLPDSCQQGDVLIDGICMSPAEELATLADLTETENNDPKLGGTAETLTLNAVDGDAFVFTGAIGAPTDLDGDGAVDQDVDTFSVEATAGDWLELMVQTTGLPAPAFVVEGPNGYVRWSSLTSGGDTARRVVIPEDGSYSITVMPALVLQSGGEVYGLGDTSWSYVGSLKAVSAPAATDHDIASGSIQLTGELTDLSDNLFTVSNLQASDLVRVDVNAVGSDAKGVVQIWNDATTLVSSHDIVGGASFSFPTPDSGTPIVLVDWKTVTGPVVGFDLGAEIAGSQVQPTLADGATESITVSAQFLDQVVVSQTNPSGADLDISITDASSTEVAAGALASGSSTEHLAMAAGDFTVTFTNNSGSSVDATLTVNVRRATDLGTLATGTVTRSSPLALLDGEKAYFGFTVAAGEVLEFDHDNLEGEEIDFVLYNSTGDEVESDTFVDAVSDSGFGKGDRYWWYADSDTEFFLGVEATADLTNATIRLNSITPAALGSVTPSTPLAGNNVRAVEEDHSDFATVSFSEALNFTGTLTPGAGEDIDFYLYDLSGNELSYEAGSGGAVDFLGNVSAAGTYLLRVEGDDAFNAWDITMDGSPALEDLGTLTADSTTTSATLSTFTDGHAYTFTFTVPAGQVIEVSHDNAESDDQDVTLYNSTGDVVDDDSSLYPTSYTGTSGAEYLYTYSHTGGTFDVVVEADNDTTGEVITVNLSTPVDLGSIAVGEAASASRSTILEDNRAAFFTVTTSARGSLTVETTTPGGEDIDLYLYDTAMTQLASAASFSGDESASSVQDPGTVIIKVPAFEDTAAFDVDASLAAAPPAAPSYSSTPSVAIPGDGTTSMTDTLTVSGSCTSIASVAVYLDVTHPYIGDLEIELTSPNGTVVRLHDASGFGSDDILGWYGYDLTVDGPGALADFNTEAADGDWELYLLDTYSTDDGTLNEWGLEMVCN